MKEKEDIIDEVHCKIIVNEMQNDVGIINLASKGYVKRGEDNEKITLSPGKEYELNNKSIFYLTDNVKFMLIKGTVEEIHNFFSEENLEDEFNKWHQLILENEKMKTDLNLTRKESYNKSFVSNNNENNNNINYSTPVNNHINNNIILNKELANNNSAISLLGSINKEVNRIGFNNSLEKVGNGVFSRIQFYERKIDSKRKEIHLEGQGEFSSLKLPVTLRKNYIMSSSGCTVQYILRNDGPLPFKAVFVVELNFSQTNFVQDGKQYSLELIEHENKKELFDRSAYKTSSGVSFVQISDVPGKLAFVLEPNEDSGFSTNLISFSRPGDDGKPRETSSTRVVSLYWNVELSAGMEIEKNISLSIIQSKKKRSVSK